MLVICVAKIYVFQCKRIISSFCFHRSKAPWACLKVSCARNVDYEFCSSVDDDNVSHCSSSFSKASTPDEKKDEAEDEEWTVVNKTPEATPVHVVEATLEAVVPTTRDIPIQV